MANGFFTVVVVELFKFFDRFSVVNFFLLVDISSKMKTLKTIDDVLIRKILDIEIALLKLLLFWQYAMTY